MNASRVYRAKPVVIVALALFIYLAVPRLVSSNNMNVVDLMLMAILGSEALNLVMGKAGQVSIGNAAFLCVGAFTAAECATKLHWPFLAVLVSATVVGAVIGALVGMPSLRVRGIYLLVATLALQYVVVYVSQRIQGAAAGPGGFVIPQARLLSQRFVTYRQWYPFLAICALLCVVLVRNLYHSPFGRAWDLVRSSEGAAALVGINVGRYKVYAFVIAAAINSLQGALLAYYNGIVSYDEFTLQVAVQYAAMVIVGGMGSIYGAAIGAAILTALPFIMTSVSGAGGNSANVELLIYGALIVVFLLVLPSGLSGGWQRLQGAKMLRAIWHRLGIRNDGGAPEPAIDTPQEAELSRG